MQGPGSAAAKQKQYQSSSSANLTIGSQKKNNATRHQHCRSAKSPLVITLSASTWPLIRLRRTSDFKTSMREATRRL